MFDVMENKSFASSYCSTECYSPATYRIAGPTTLCGSGTYTSPIHGSGRTYTWTASPTGAFTNPSGTGETFTTSNVGTGSGTITLVIGGDCPLTLTQNVRVGAPEAPQFDGPNQLDCSTYAQTYYITNYSAGLTYTTRASGVVNVKPVLNNGSFQVIVRSSGQGSVDVTATSNCGSITNTLYVTVNQCSNYAVYPNPAADEVQISQGGDSAPVAASAAGATPVAAAATGISTVRLYDSYGQLRLEQAAHGARAVRLGLSKLPPGPYVLHIVDGQGTVSRQQLMIER